jgi:hypothetical protein
MTPLEEYLNAWITNRLEHSNYTIAPGEELTFEEVERNRI